ncbi:MAG: aminotransferase class I/II-fold pyridoxal phosphate-dependent enzyme [Bacteroidales bacterium]|nr:aminotransferase class I/II-fold pyridoxal phosphate-dependent enzyme [Bacteroidales bacterium]MDD2425195.1 aminotransferase class I/II-fold pyridoxal phosphate-dependent enzyme [Bacteroidales bacterium]MDD3989049.1 aminotransferase class I/II-fold pyridoxal phosphate-dependent enzyme [Bacteroidales bacterium]MDD4638140.1 aminotransferase class I/II-fold pyridoxal phosphate-dependent enzyme [Bacteroidales bacterium]
MITAANRTFLVNEYYFSSKLREIARMNSAGREIINLGIGNPDMPAPGVVAEKISSLCRTAGSNGYQSYNGIPELREAFALWYEKYYSIKLDPCGEILPLMGSKEGIMHITMAFVNPGEKVLIPDPGYPAYRSASLIAGAEVIEYDLLEENDWEPDFEKLESMDLNGVKLMWINYPNMPTGKKATTELLKKAVDFGHRNQILICNDNPYSMILNENPLSILAIEGAAEVAIELNSLSKSHNMAGFRVGMVAANSSFISSVLKIKSNMDSGMYMPIQMAAAAALELGEGWYRAINREYQSRRELVEKLFDLMECSYNKRQAGLFVWAKIPAKFRDCHSFSDYYLNRRGIFITPGEIFGKNGREYARISLCASQTILKKAIQRLEL